MNALQIILYYIKHKYYMVTHDKKNPMNKSAKGILLNDALNTFTLGRMVNDYPDSERRNPLPPLQGRKDMFYFTTHSTRFIYGYMASDIW